MKKIVLIGPVYPYKGGISHYTSLMHKALSKTYDVTMVSYKMQYPRFLFKKEQKDFSNDSFQVNPTFYWINTALPWNWIQCAKKINRLNPDLIVIQWWHPYFTPCYCVLLSLLRKIPKIFICHNVIPHENFPGASLLTKLALKKGNGFIVHSKSDEQDLVKLIPDAVFCRTVLPTYNAFKLRGIDRTESRKILEIESETKVLLFFGLVRKYKGLEYLIKALPRVCASLANVKLFIVGDFGEMGEYYSNLIQEEKVEQNIIIKSGYLPDREVEPYFAASDLVVLPYISATQSAIVQVAFGFEKPVVVTNVGGLPDVVEDGKTGYVVESQNIEQLSEAIISYFKDNKEKEFSENVRKEAYRFSWDRMTETIENLTTIIEGVRN